MMRDRTRTTLALCVGISAVITGCASAPPTPTGNEGTAAQKPGADQEAKPTETPATTEALATSPRMRTLAELTEGFSNAPLAKAAVLRPGVQLEAQPGAQAEKALTQRAPTLLDVKYARSRLGDRDVYVRTYRGELIAPTIRVRPGETLWMELKNRLPPDPDDLKSGISHHGGHGVKGTHEGTSINTPHGFNVTNLHTHGLHVSPDFPVKCKMRYTTDKKREENCNASDNVLIDVAPGKSKHYQIEIPKDHPPGTHWYHAHKHGAVAMQMATGMAGALIIEGGIDDLAELKNANEEVMVFQQLAVTPCGRNPISKSGTDKGGASEDCTVEDPETKVITTYESCDDYFKRFSKLDPPFQLDPPFPKGASCVENFAFVFGPGKWQGLETKFRVRTSINGQIGPMLNAKQGEILRWRMVHGGIRETIRLAVVREKDFLSQQVCNPLTSADAIKKRLPLQIVAYDGITTGRLDPVDNAELQPGYRLDTLLRIDEPGEFLLVDLETSANESLRGQPESFDVLARLNVAPSTAPPAALPKVEALEKLAPYKHVEDQEVKGCQYATFSIDFTANAPPAFQVNKKAFDPHNPPRTMELGTAEEWVVNALPVTPVVGQPSRPLSHPFHIHVNPFEIVDGYDSIPKGTWKDTLLVNTNEPVRLRTRYEDFTGKFVLHCHILDHEDQGMMEMVEVVAKGAKSSRCPTLAGPNLCAPTPPTDGSCGDAQPGAPKK